MSDIVPIPNQDSGSVVLDGLMIFISQPENTEELIPLSQELYERSLQIEGPRAGENTRKMFQWFQR